jgi:hypothetical protein
VSTIRRHDGGRSAGFLLFLLGHFAVAGGIAVSRGGGLAERYVTISAIGVAAAYLGWLSCASVPKWLGLSLAVVLFTANIGPGQHYGHDHRSLYRGLESDLRGGMPIGFLRDKYQTLLRVGENLEPALERLRSHRVREFAHAVPTPEMTAIPIAGAHWGGALATPPGQVLGVSVEIEVTQLLPWSEVRLTWDSGKQAVVYPPRSPGVYRLRLWVNDRPRDAKLAATDGIAIRSAAWLSRAEP